MIILFVLIAFNSLFPQCKSIDNSSTVAGDTSLMIGPLKWSKDSESKASFYRLANWAQWYSGSQFLTLGAGETVTIGIYSDTVRVYFQDQPYGDIFTTNFYEEDLIHPPLYIREKVVYQTPEIEVNGRASLVEIETKYKESSRILLTNENITLDLKIGWVNDTIPVFKELYFKSDSTQEEMIIGWDDHHTIETLRYHNAEKAEVYSRDRGKLKKQIMN